MAPNLIARALERARAEWLAGDPDAWERYTDGLARLERYFASISDGRPASARPAPPADRPPVSR